MWLLPLAVLTSLGLAWLLYRAVVVRFITSPYRQLPGPAPSSLLRGNLAEIFAAGPGELHLKWIPEYGRVLRYHGFVGEEDRLLIADPKALHHILLTNSYEFPKPDKTREALANMLGRGILFAEGDVHRRQKRILAPAFSPGNVAALGPEFLHKASVLRDLWSEQVQADQTLDVFAGFSRCTLDIIGQSGMGYDFDSLRNGQTPLATAFNSLLPTAGNHSLQGFSNKWFLHFSPYLCVACQLFARSVDYLRQPVLSKLPNERARDLKKALAILQSEGRKIIEQKTRQLSEDETSTRKDLITLLMKANLDAVNEKSRLSDEELRGQLTTFLLAGHETTATACTWALHELSRHKDLQEQLRVEIRQSKADNGGELDPKALGALPFLDAVVREVLRIRPPVSGTIREAAHDDVLPLAYPLKLKNGKLVDSIPVKAHTPLFIPIVAINQSKSVWGEDADMFRPGRWLEPMDPQIAQDAQGYTAYSSLLTFLGGPRGCIGYRFSVLELKCILATVIEHFDFSWPEGLEIIPMTALVARPYLKADIKAGPQLPLKVRLAP